MMKVRFQAFASGKEDYQRMGLTLANALDRTATMSLRLYLYMKMSGLMLANGCGITVTHTTDWLFFRTTVELIQQAPFEDCSKEKYEAMLSALENVDLTKIIEEDDNTDLKGEAACAGGCV